MAAIYPKALEAFANGQIDWLTNKIRAYLIDAADYTYSTTHEFLSSVPVGSRVANSDLTGKTNVSGALDANDTVLAGVSGDPSEAVILVRAAAVDPGTDLAETAQRLIAYIDNYSGFPVTPNGTNITVQWPSDANRILRI